MSYAVRSLYLPRLLIIFRIWNVCFWILKKILSWIICIYCFIDVSPLFYYSRKLTLIKLCAAIKYLIKSLNLNNILFNLIKFGLWTISSFSTNKLLPRSIPFIGHNCSSTVSNIYVLFEFWLNLTKLKHLFQVNWKFESFRQDGNVVKIQKLCLHKYSKAMKIKNMTMLKYFRYFKLIN